MSSNYPPGTWVGDPRAPWNETDAPDASETIDAMGGREFFDSSNWDLDGTLDCFDGRVLFDVPNLYGKRWSELSDDERDAFDAYAVAVRMFASLYERGMKSD